MEVADYLSVSRFFFFTQRFSLITIAVVNNLDFALILYNASVTFVDFSVTNVTVKKEAVLLTGLPRFFDGNTVFRRFRNINSGNKLDGRVPRFF